MRGGGQTQAAVFAAAALLWIGACSKAPAPGAAQAPDAAASKAAAGAPHLNLLLVTLDTTRTDHLGAYGDEDAQTPAFDALAARGALFENAFSPCPLTLPAHATMLTGLQPPEHGVRINGEEALGPAPATLPALLSDAGYRTGAFVSAFVLSRKFGLARGFATYDDDLSAAEKQEVPDELSRSRSGRATVDAALSWIGGDAAQPFFAWVHLYDAHHPWIAHDELAGTPLAGKAGYDADVAYADLQLGRLLAFLDEQGLRERTVVVVAGDHGEGLGDHGDVEHGHLLNHEVLHVPLAVFAPGRTKAGSRVAAVVSLRVVMPTARDLLGGGGKDAGTGRSLAAAVAGSAIASEPSYAETDFPLRMYGWSPLRSLTGDDWKVVRTARPELYDRKTDTAEIYNLASVRAALLAEQDAALAAVESRMRAASETVPAQLSAADRERLESLGYAAGSSSAPAPGGTSADANTAGKPLRDSNPRSLRDIKDMLPVKQLETELERGTALGLLSPAEIVEANRRLVAASPESARFHARLGAALLDAGKLDEADASLREALRLQPDNPDAGLNLARVELRQGHPARARDLLMVVLARQPDRADAHLSMGQAMAALDQRDLALGHFQEAIRLDPGLVAAHRGLGRALRDSGKKDAALVPLGRAAELAPRVAAVQFDYAAGLAEAGRHAESIPVFRAALELAPDDPDIRNDLGAALQAAGDPEGAIAEYQETIRRRPNFARAHYNLGVQLAARGDERGAIASYGKALELQPKWVQPAERLAWLLATAKDEKLREPKRAVALAEEAVEISASRSPRPMAALAEAYAAAGRPEDAVRSGERALQLARVVGNAELAGEIEERLARYREAAKSAPRAD